MSAVTIGNGPEIAWKPAASTMRHMDNQPFQPEGVPQVLEMSPHAGYDESALGVECAWPTAEREVSSTYC